MSVARAEGLGGSRRAVVSHLHRELRTNQFHALLKDTSAEQAVADRLLPARDLSTCSTAGAERARR